MAILSNLVYVLRVPDAYTSFKVSETRQRPLSGQYALIKATGMSKQPSRYYATNSQVLEMFSFFFQVKEP